MESRAIIITLIVPSGLISTAPAPQKAAYVIADNKLTENGGWDQDFLSAEIEALKTLDFDLTLTGFSL